MTNSSIINPLKNVDTGMDGAHCVKVMEHMRLSIPQAITLALTVQRSTMALAKQLHQKFLYRTKNDNANARGQVQGVFW